MAEKKSQREVLKKEALYSVKEWMGIIIQRWREQGEAGRTGVDYLDIGEGEASLASGSTSAWKF